MRRFHVLPISIFALSAVIAAALLVAPAGASRAPSGAPKPPNRPAVTAVTLTAAPNPSQAGQPILLSGRVVGIRKAGVPVRLWRKRPRDRRFHLAFSTPTETGGNYAVLVSGIDVNTNVQWYATTHGVTSSTALHRVRATLTLKSSATAAAPGEPVGLSGHVTAPARAEAASGLCAPSRITMGSRETTSRRPGDFAETNPSFSGSAGRARPRIVSRATIAAAALRAA